MRFTRAIPRRSFLLRLAAWSGAGAILPALLRGAKASATGAGHASPPGQGFGIAANASAGPLDRTQAALFEQQIGSRFRVIPSSGSSPQFVSLAKVTRSQTIAAPGRGAAVATPAFSLIFRGHAGLALDQDTYRVEHPQLGVFPLFLVPIGPEQADMRYQAVFA
jgi:hypothetical protein